MGINFGAIFDRDGVVNVDNGYVGRILDFKFREDIFDTLEHFKSRDYKLILATNQSGIDRGFYSLGDFFKVTAFMQKELITRIGFGFDRVYFCPHLESAQCSCRKPKPGMLLRALCDFDLDSKKSFFVGDKPSDMQAALNAGIKGYFLTDQNLHFFENSREIVRIKSLRDLKEIYG